MVLRRIEALDLGLQEATEKLSEYLPALERVYSSSALPTTGRLSKAQEFLKESAREGPDGSMTADLKSAPPDVLAEVVEAVRHALAYAFRPLTSFRRWIHISNVDRLFHAMRLVPLVHIYALFPIPI